jgi:hypothetical protein
MNYRLLFSLALVAVAPVLAVACDGGTEADQLGVGAECTSDDDCDADTDQICLTNFKGGYCGIRDCTANADCPEGSACVAHDDGTNYCFRSCTDKPECNANRTVENESNCSSSVEYVEAETDGKACVPPSGS